ncbi:MAG: hypothetical protein GY862_25000, partial [Gammaproteobacteria bacterium]|nr:hypothetical protein [Gammaproteobacteria bacterium]
MKRFYFLILCGMSLLMLALTGGASQEFSIDKARIRALIKATHIEITLPITYQKPVSADYDVSVSIEDLQGKAIGSSQTVLELSEKTRDITLFINARIDQEKLAAYVLHYAAQKDDEKIEGKKSVFYAVRQIETQLLMQRQFYANSQAAVRIIVNDPSIQQATAGANVIISLAGKELFQGKTNQQGTLDAQFNLPNDVIGDQQLTVIVKVDEASETIHQPIHIKDVHKILLTTDKPLYQPGQVIHIRSLALKKPDLLPAGEEQMIFEVEDSKGNKVFKHAQTTNPFGISSADFQLAHELNEGHYKIRAIFGQNTQEKTVTVERYVLPKFNIVFDSDNRYYQPGQMLKGELQADYFFGKPVTGGTVIVTLSKFDVEFEKFAEIKGKTDANGHYQFETKLPDHFVGQPLEQGNAFVKLDVVVTDTADHEEQKTVTKTVAAAPLNIVVIPESGTFVPGLENIFYLAASYPDGTPAEVEVNANFTGTKPFAFATDSSGIGEMRATPQGRALTVSIAAKDKSGHAVSKNFQFNADGRTEQILLRTDKALYKVGETIAVDVFANKPKGTVYLDLIKDGQTFLTKSVELENGRGKLDIEAAVSGSLQLHAYQIISSSDIIRDTKSLQRRAYRIISSSAIIRDTKLLYVEAAGELQIGINTAKPTYLPGEEAQIDFHVTNTEGHPVLAALGVNIVDESVFALQEMQPGLEKIYFMLEKEIMTPRYEIHAYSMEGIVMDTPFVKDIPQQRRHIREKAAQVLLASAENLVDYDVNINTFAHKIQTIRPLILGKVMEDFRKIYKAINTYSRKKKKVLTAKQGIKAVIQGGFLKQADMLDSWGNAYHIQPHGEDFTSFYFSCIGPDELKNTQDDIWDYAYIDLQTERSFFDWLLGRKKKGRPRANLEVMNKAVPTIRAAGIENEAEAEMMMDFAAEPADKSKANGGDEAAGPRIREYFPETLYTNPAILTDEQGNASITLTMADSITSWRLSSMASSLNGMLGSGTSAITVFQDFFVDIDLPVTLTQNDQISIPIAIYNYLPGIQNVRLKLTKEDWFELVADIPEKVVTLNSGQVDVVYFTLKVKQIGWHKLTIHAYGSEMSDAIARRIEVLPDGKQFEMTWNGRLEGDIEQVVTILKDAIDDASKIIVKVYPGIFSQIVEGLDSILRMPSGCFEQTSSTTYPNIMVLDYMKQANQITPEIQMKAESFINTGYQRLLSYEVSGGGFEWFGRTPAHKILTAYGLMEFYDMAQVHDVDPNVITRTQQWLVSQQEKNGSWKPVQNYLDVVASKFTNDVMRNTAYIAWGLLSTGYTGKPATKAIAYIQGNIDEIKDTYTLALTANTLVLHNSDDPVTAKILKTLMNKK